MDDAERAALIIRMFSALTARLEDAGMLAVDGQGGGDLVGQRARAAELSEIGQQIVTMADAVHALAETDAL